MPLLPEIQEAFSHLLGDQNELTQEMASRGMSVVYSLGDESAQKQLLDGLMGVLQGIGPLPTTHRSALNTHTVHNQTLAVMISSIVGLAYMAECDNVVYLCRHPPSPTYLPQPLI